VVQNARKAAAETSGATSGARVAAYLRGEGEAKPAGDRILDRLAAPQPETPLPTQPGPVAETIDRRRLDALSQPTDLAESNPAPGPSEEKKAELEEANEKLASLLNKPKP
jgi:hypothetical protein